MIDENENLNASQAGDESASPEPVQGQDSNGSEDAAAEPEESLEERLKLAETKAEENFNRMLYLQAEFENYKKRMEREKQDIVKYGTERTILEFLPAMDHLAMALTSAEQAQDTEAIVEGLKMTYKNLAGIFNNLGVEFLETVGKPFDPNFHEALMHQENRDIEPNLIIQEFQKGCQLHGRLLRPAKVIVSKGKD